MWRVFARFSSDGLGWELAPLLLARACRATRSTDTVCDVAFQGEGCDVDIMGYREIKMMPFRAGRPMYPG